MKHSKKIFALVTVFVLILSLSTMAYAASDAYTYSVSEIDTNKIDEDVSTVHFNHYYGIATNLRYSYEARTHSFDQSQFNSQYLSGLMQAYRDAGYKSPLTIPASSGTKRLDATAADGVYGVLLYTEFAYGTWDVKIGNTITATGTFRNAPVGIELKSYRFGPLPNSQ